MQYDVIIIGTGFGSLTAAALLCKRGFKVCLLEQAKYPGGCATSYKRKGYWFETGATTLVGLDEGMPLWYLLEETGIRIPGLRKLEIPMQVHLPDGTVATRYQHLEAWIAEAERVFGKYNQRPFWEYCYNISRQVWWVSLQQQSFPFSTFGDVWQGIRSFRPEQLRLLPGAFRTVADLLKHYSLDKNQLFTDFVNEQLLITAQNHMGEVNALFGATALCYTLYSNYYIDGGLINLVNPVLDYCRQQGAIVKYGHQVNSIKPIDEKYCVSTSKGHFTGSYLISGIPLNNTLDLYQDAKLQHKLQHSILPSEKLNGAFTMSLVLKKQEHQPVLHHQLHVPEGLPVIGSKSFFVSFSHPADTMRAPAGEQVASISTHIPDPSKTYISRKDALAQTIVDKLHQEGLVNKADMLSYQSATPGAWQFWTKRSFGAVGGYPQYSH
ncbi:MAG TPA: NAD(P)-binding protein, partial [Pontibacter sp.]